MNMHYQILVIGGGTAGIMTASSLLKKNSKLSIAVIEPSETHWYQPAWTLVGGGTYSYEKTKRPMQSVMPKNAIWIKDRVISIHPNQNSVDTTLDKKYTYDFLIVAPGLKLDASLVEGLPESIDKGVVCSNYTNPNHTWDVIKNFKGGVALFTQPPKPYKCGGAPQKIMYLADDYFAKNGVKNSTKVVYASASDIIFAVPEIAKTLMKVVDRKEIGIKFNHELKKIDSNKQIAWFKVSPDYKEHNPIELDILQEKELIGIRYDMLHLVPPNTPPDFIKDSVLSDSTGWMDVDQYTLQHKEYPNIFGLGDVTNVPTSKTGAAIRKQAPIVVHNILELITYQKLGTTKYDGYSSCPFITGYGKMVLAEFDYTKKFTPDPKLKKMWIKDSSKEHWRLWILKKYILPYLYWNKMLKGKEV
ncbi:NAD(P)/FAD-dependent oxidoreductase [Aquimarina muelleri]|uniref:Pyridine nucleotide-disulfide oxidoreductase n=1 Tax=Aquimarina muelleri TaxID=279356 RepID=A0A918JWF1_9FLAO|nr:FAD/NAD(P)-binding oxidoreductase [Aquimarina muelleri]MCX2761837.1 NAD(P)/FAD-dependent oxidoreductase [Aquimarina muelleri]GGX23607.1 pyridine nucleotide-disulfide oxidoreductase [Aquimarina muelleri]